jgi:glycosyltransferase involved in cell wall biosynthesis
VKIMHVIYVVTSIAGEKCGVVDYTRQLALHISKMVTKVTIEELPSWTFFNLIKLRRKYRDEAGIVFHLQYPTIGMGKSLSPAFLNYGTDRKKHFITLHEFNQFSLIRKLYFSLSTMLGVNYIFTNSHEKNKFICFFSYAKIKSEVIPIGNNITPIPHEKPAGMQKQRLVYFGQITASKGIEQYLEVICLLREKGIDIPCAIIGATLCGSDGLLQKISLAAKQHNIECIFDLPAGEVSRELHESTIAFLPFPMGIEDKRGSALACLKHSVAVVTKHSYLTPLWWKRSTYHADNAEVATALIQSIATEVLPRVPDPIALKKAMGEREWDNIARKHLNSYIECGGI